MNIRLHYKIDIDIPLVGCKTICLNQILPKSVLKEFIDNETILVIKYDKDRFVVHWKYVLKEEENIFVI